MKTISGKVVSSRPISFSKAAKFLTNFVSAETEASQAVSAFLRRTSAAFNELSQLHRQLRGSRSDRKPNNHLSHTLDRGGGGSRDPGPASGSNPVVDLGREEIGGVRKKGKKKRERDERVESVGEEGSRDLGPTWDANPIVDSGGENSTGFGESGSVRKKGKKKEKMNEGGEYGDFSEKRSEIEDGEDNVGFEAGKKKKKKNGDKLRENRGEIEDRGREGEESIGIEVRKKKKRKIIEVESVGNDVSEEQYSSKKKRRRKSEGDD